eukprot:969278_1
MSSKCIVLTVVFGLLVVGGIVLNFMQSNDTTTGQEKLEDQLKNVQTAFDDSTKDEYSETLEEAENVWAGSKGPGPEQAHAPDAPAASSIVPRYMPVYEFLDYFPNWPSDITSPEPQIGDASSSVANANINVPPFLMQSNQDGTVTLSRQIPSDFLAKLERIDELQEFSVVCNVVIFDSGGSAVYEHIQVPLNSKGDTDVDTCMKSSFPSKYHIGIKSGKWTGLIEYWQFERIPAAKKFDNWHRFRMLDKIPIVEAPKN